MLRSEGGEDRVPILVQKFASLKAPLNILVLHVKEVFKGAFNGAFKGAKFLHQNRDPEHPNFVEVISGSPFGSPPSFLSQCLTVKFPRRFPCFLDERMARPMQAQALSPR